MSKLPDWNRDWGAGMIGIRIGRAERNQERCETGKGRYAIVGGPGGELLIVEDLTEAARRQWSRK